MSMFDISMGLITGALLAHLYWVNPLGETETLKQRIDSTLLSVCVDIGIVLASLMFGFRYYASIYMLISTGKYAVILMTDYKKKFDI